MKNELLYDFTVDRPSKTVFITREFAAELQLVWDAFTKPEILDQWVAPKPWLSRTEYMNFKVGGKRFYAMVSPEGVERWSIQEFTSITPGKGFTMYNTFSDKEENRALPGSEWRYDFTEQDGITKVSIIIKNESLERMDKLIEMGFVQGFKATIDNLEDLLSELIPKIDHDWY